MNPSELIDAVLTAPREQMNDEELTDMAVIYLSEFQVTDQGNTPAPAATATGQPAPEAKPADATLVDLGAIRQLKDTLIALNKRTDLVDKIKSNANTLRSLGQLSRQLLSLIGTV